jgi:hypothetical protein
MWGSPFEILLANLRGRMPDPMYSMSTEKAYEELKRLSGEDFGFDDKLWENWGFSREMFVNPPRFLRYWSNFRHLLPEDSLYYVPKNEAYEKLKQFSGQDFGDDEKLWEQWGRLHGHLR